MSSTGYQSFGVTVANGTSSGGTFSSPLAELIDITPPTLVVEDIALSNNQSGTLTTGRPVREYLPGWVEGGEVPAKLVYLPATETALFALLGKAVFYKIVFPDLTSPSNMVFPGYLKSLGTPMPQDGKIEIDATFKVTGVPVFTAGS